MGDSVVIRGHGRQAVYGDSLHKVLLGGKVFIRNGSHQYLIFFDGQIRIVGEYEFSSYSFVVGWTSDAEIGGGGSDSAGEGPISVWFGVVVEGRVDCGG